MDTFRARLHRAPNASIEMIQKVFSAFEDDEEFRLIMFALGPLYSESYNANSALKSSRNTIFRAETHSTLQSRHVHKMIFN